MPWTTAGLSKGRSGERSSDSCRVVRYGRTAQALVGFPTLSSAARESLFTGSHAEPVWETTLVKRPRRAVQLWSQHVKMQRAHDIHV